MIRWSHAFAYRKAMWIRQFSIQISRITAASVVLIGWYQLNAMRKHANVDNFVRTENSKSISMLISIRNLKAERVGVSVLVKEYQEDRSSCNILVRYFQQIQTLVSQESRSTANLHVRIWWRLRRVKLSIQLIKEI